MIKTAIRELGADNIKMKSMKKDNVLWSSISKQRFYIKIYAQLKKFLYNWVFTPSKGCAVINRNDYLKVYIDSQTGK